MNVHQRNEWNLLQKFWRNWNNGIMSWLNDFHTKGPNVCYILPTRFTVPGAGLHKYSQMESCLVLCFNALNWNIAKINTENKGLCIGQEIKAQFLLRVESTSENLRRLREGDQRAPLISNLHIDENMSQTKANISQRSDMYNPAMLDKKFQWWDPYFCHTVVFDYPVI